MTAGIGIPAIICGTPMIILRVTAKVEMARVVAKAAIPRGLVAGNGYPQPKAAPQWITCFLQGLLAVLLYTLGASSGPRETGPDFSGQSRAARART